VSTRTEVPARSRACAARRAPPFELSAMSIPLKSCHAEDRHVPLGGIYRGRRSFERIRRLI
jgi:hypothetical protein